MAGAPANGGREGPGGLGESLVLRAGLAGPDLLKRPPRFPRTVAGSLRHLTPSPTASSLSFRALGVSPRRRPAGVNSLLPTLLSGGPRGAPPQKRASPWTDVTQTVVSGRRGCVWPGFVEGKQNVTACSLFYFFFNSFLRPPVFRETSILSRQFNNSSFVQSLLPSLACAPHEEAF